MCGIAGVVRPKDSKFDLRHARSLFEEIMLQSQIRGKDSSGLAVVQEDLIDVYKDMVQAKELLKDQLARTILDKLHSQFIAIGHSRMETNGSFYMNHNNQPVIKDGCVVIHNGIVVNDQDVWTKLPGLKREFEVDTEVICSALSFHIQRAKEVKKGVKEALSLFEGAWSVAVLFESIDGLLLATNTGSLYTLEDPVNNVLFFASEKTFLDQIKDSEHKGLFSSEARIKQLRPQTALWIELGSGKKKLFSTQLDQNDIDHKIDISDIKTARRINTHQIRRSAVSDQILINNSAKYRLVERAILDEYKRIKTHVDNIKRCSKCVLPESMPYIAFDENGVCNYCHNHISRTVLGREKLEDAIAPYRKANGDPDCIVSFSGGRDSSYALHYVKKELGLQPVAYSYDWGMLTDLGRRNQARMTGALGVEHLLVTPDIQKKRKYIRMNIEAWLKRPSLGIVPLFMAGDKQYFYYLNKVREQTGIKLVIYADNALEKTDFKYGFAGVGLSSKQGAGKAYDIGILNSLKLLWYYGKEYIINPSYFNASLMDTFTAYLSSFAVPKDYEYIFRYLLWEEKEIENTLINGYNWELAKDTKSSWRIGDGTAAFYNYIYYTAAGFTEQDTFRSNQIREGVISRSQGLSLAAMGNEPRVESIIWYCDTIGIDALQAINQINQIPKLFQV